MLRVSLLDTLSPALAAVPERAKDALSAKANALAADLRAKILQKLSGEVLNSKSGALAASIVAFVDDGSTNVSVRLATSDDVRYAALHEFGGTIPPHQIVPDKAKALAFLIAGKQAFAARVNIPAVTMPERSYLRSSLLEMTDEIGQEFTAAVVEAMP